MPSGLLEIGACVVVVVDGWTNSGLEMGISGDEAGGGSLKPGGKKSGDTSANRILEKILLGSFLSFSVVELAIVGGGVVDVAVVVTNVGAAVDGWMAT